MEKNYNSNVQAKRSLPAQSQPKSQVSMETKILLAKIGLLICIIILIVARTSH